MTPGVPDPELAFTEGAALTDWRERGSVLVEGPDALTYLHSLVSQDVVGLAVGEGAHALLLHPQGKLDTDLRLLRTGEADFRLDCEVGRGGPLASSLRRFKIRVKAEVTDTTGAWGCLSLRGPQAVATAEAASDVAVPGTQHHHTAWPGTALVVVRADWPDGRPGVDVIGPVGQLDSAAVPALLAAGATPAGVAAWEAARVAAGVPRQGLDTDERTIPQEAFLEIDAVSFTKGCFLGQELVCRIDTRGHVNRYLRAVRILDDTTPPPGAGIVYGDKEVGTLTSVAPSRSGTLALGYVRREVELPAAVLVRWDGGEARATAAALPGKP